jgi:hypothetical protein
MNNLPPPGPPGPPYGSVPDPDSEANPGAWSGYQPGAPLGEPRLDPYAVQPYAPYGTNPYASAAGYPLQQNHQGASEAQTWGIVGIVVLTLGAVCCALLALAAAIPGTVAIAKGRRAMAEIDASPSTWANRSQAKTGFVCGIVATSLAAVVGLMGLAFLGLVFVLGV